VLRIFCRKSEACSAISLETKEKEEKDGEVEGNSDMTTSATVDK